MSFTEFCCRSGGSNMNGGGLASNAEPATSPVYSATNGGWNSGTGVFTPTSGNPSATVTVGDWASVFNDGATTPVFIGRVTAVNSTTITISTTLKAGISPTTAGTGRSINVGGAWAGPSGSINFPFNFVVGNMAASTDLVRVNFKNDQTYNITATIDHQSIGPIWFQGYTTTFGDGGRATIDGGTSGTSYILILNNNGNGPDRNWLADLIFQNNGASGSADGVVWNGGPRNGSYRCVVHAVRGNGFFGSVLIECEAYACNQSNTSGCAGIRLDNGGQAIRCISHDNSGSNNAGFYTQDPNTTLINCISDTNTIGFWEQNITGSNRLIGCDFYNNSSDGYQHFTSEIVAIIVNCNFISNGGYGINVSTGTQVGYLQNCGFFGNTSGAKNNTTRMFESGTVNYAGSPYVDGPNGDFRINLAAAKGAGRGAFTQTAASYAGAIGYPDIGAAQHQDAGGSSGPIAQLRQFNRGAPY